jgi:hypothetical protein
MPTSWQLECLKARIQSLDREIKRVADKEHPYTEPDTIYRALLRVLDSWGTHFDEARDLVPTDTDSMLDPVFKRVAIEVDKVFRVFGLADRVDSARIPFEILRSLAWAATELLDEQCKIVVRLDTAYNYSITSFRRMFEQLNWGKFWAETAENHSDSEPRKSTVLVLGFPSPDASAILLHALAAHELGHEILDRYHSEIERIRVRLLNDAKGVYRDQLEEYILDNMRRGGGVSRDDAYEKARQQLEVRLDNACSKWISEIWSDLVAIRLVGPASLAAFDRVTLNEGSPSDSHPSGLLRRRVAERYVREKMPHIAEDPICSSVFLSPATSLSERQLSPSSQLLKTLYPLLDYVCTRSLDPLSNVLDQVASPNRQQIYLGKSGAPRGISGQLGSSKCCPGQRRYQAV